jgi:hypothetical protein
MIKEPFILVDGGPVDYSGLPEAHRETVRRYIEHGLHPGSGWLAIFQYRLDAVLMVDGATQAQIPRIVLWLRHHAPAACFGSQDKVAAWLEAHSRARVRKRGHMREESR